MRCTIAGHSFYLQASEVETAMREVKPELITGESVQIGRHSYPIKQVGAVITGQDRRDFSVAEVSRALQRLGFSCRSTPPTPPGARTQPPAPSADPVAPVSNSEPTHPARDPAPSSVVPPAAYGFLEATPRQSDS